MKTRDTIFRIVQLPCPLRLDTLVMCYLLARQGFINEKTYIRFDWRTLAYKQLDLVAESYILYVTPLYVKENLTLYLKKEKKLQQKKLLVLLDNSNKALEQTIKCLSLSNNGSEIFKKITRLLDLYLADKWDFMKSVNELKRTIPKFVPHEDKETRVILVPNDQQVIKEELSTEDNVPNGPVPSMLVVNDELVENLLGQTFVILIAGPARSGKSTVIVSLHYACSILARCIMDAPFWQPKKYIVTRSINADVATPVSPFIKPGVVNELLHLPKHEWTTDMAWAVVDSIEEQKKSALSNETKILFVDLPGGKDGKITDIIKIIASLGDAAVLLSHGGAGYPVIKAWQQLFFEMGIVQIASIETYLAQDSGLSQSFMTRVAEDKSTVLVEGKIMLLPRKFQPWDPVISFLSSHILCRALPQMVQDRRAFVNS